MGERTTPAVRPARVKLSWTSIDVIASAPLAAHRSLALRTLAHFDATTPLLALAAAVFSLSCLAHSRTQQISARQVLPLGSSESVEPPGATLRQADGSLHQAGVLADGPRQRTWPNGPVTNDPRSQRKAAIKHDPYRYAHGAPS